MHYIIQNQCQKTLLVAYTLDLFRNRFIFRQAQYERFRSKHSAQARPDLVEGNERISIVSEELS